MYVRKTPNWLKALLPQAIWNFSRQENRIYLTFDDGPIPQLTPWVLSLLEKYGARATFFYVGDNIKKYPWLAQEAFACGHTLANHTFNHLKWWKTSTAQYLNNIEKCEEALREVTGGQSQGLFRPPYGQINFLAVSRLAGSYRLVMWDYLTGDFDRRLSPADCHSGAMQGVGSGSVVVYHENMKAEARLKYSLPLLLDYFSQQGYQFCAIQ